MATAAKERTDEDADRLRAWLPPGSTVYTTCDHVSRSGMHRRINVHAIVDGDMMWLTGHAASVVGFTRDKKHDGLRVGGCGMDMGFHVVSTLSCVLYPDGFGCIGEKCPSNDHANGDRDYTPHRKAKARPCPASLHAAELPPAPYCAACMTEDADREYVPHWHRNTWSRFYVCRPCVDDGEWLAAHHWVGTEAPECRTCDGSGQLPPGHWHRSGDYALRHRWL